MFAAGLQEAVQVLLAARPVILSSGHWAVLLMVLLQDGHHVMVAEVHGFVQRRVSPSEEKYMYKTHLETKVCSKYNVAQASPLQIPMI